MSGDPIAQWHAFVERRHPALLDARMLALTRWMAQYYCCSWGWTLDHVLPAVIKEGTAAKTVLKVSAAKSPEELRARAAEILERAAGRPLRPIEIYDINMYVAKAVLAGGIRRSATICL